MDAQTLIEIRSALADLHAAVSAIATQVNAHSVAADLRGAQQSIHALTNLAGKQITAQAKGADHD